MGQRLRKLEEEHRPTPERREHKGWLPKVGDRVRVLSLGKAGEVLALSDDGRELTVRCGVMRLSLELAGIEGCTAKNPPHRSRASRWWSQPPQPRQPRSGGAHRAQHRGCARPAGA